MYFCGYSLHLAQIGVIQNMITLSKIISDFVGLPWIFQFFDNFSLDSFNIQHFQSNPCEKWWHLRCNMWGYTLKLHEWECFKLTLNSFQMLFLHEGYVWDYDLSQKHNTKSTWNPSLGNILMILLDSLLDLSCNLQNSVTFLENFFLFTIRHSRGRKSLRVTRQI